MADNTNSRFKGGYLGVWMVSGAYVNRQAFSRECHEGVSLTYVYDRQSKRRDLCPPLKGRGGCARMTMSIYAYGYPYACY